MARASARSERPQHSVPKEIENREIAVGMTVMQEVKFLLAPEPGEPAKPRSFHMIFPVKEDVRVERRGAGSGLHDEEVERQDEVGARSGDKDGDQKEGGEIASLI